MPKDTRLTVRIEDDEIVVRIGIDSLKHMTEDFEPFEDTVKVTDPSGWAQAVVDAINEPNDGNEGKTLAQEMFEAAIDEAVATGGQFLEVEDSDEG